MKQIKHRNILPLYGVSTTISDVSLVFPWYNNGNIKQFLEKNPGVNRYHLVSILKLMIYSKLSCEPNKQLLGAVQGLLFLHSSGVVHGALQPVCETLLSLIRFNIMNRVTY